MVHQANVGRTIACCLLLMGTLGDAAAQDRDSTGAQNAQKESRATPQSPGGEPRNSATPVEGDNRVLGVESGRTPFMLDASDGEAVSGVEAELSAVSKAALGMWIDLARALGFRIALSRSQDLIVMGRVPEIFLVQGVQLLERAHRVVDPLIPMAVRDEQRAFITILFNREDVESDAWATLLDDLQQRRFLQPQDAQRLSADPRGVLVRDNLVLVQPTEAITGEAEQHQFSNEMVNGYVRALLTWRCGPMPKNILWGMAYLAEVRVLGTVYCFSMNGFIDEDSHFEWKSKTARMLERMASAESFALSYQAYRGIDAGQPSQAQMITWATLDYLATEARPEIHALIEGLAQLHEARGPAVSGRGSSSLSYRGKKEDLRELLAAHLDHLTVERLVEHLRRDSPSK